MGEVRWYDPGHGAVTPWGPADCAETLAEGIVVYSTPSHGGVRLTAKRERELDAKLREHGLTAEEARMGYAPGWYEEDCCILAVVFCWPELFSYLDGRDGSETLDQLRHWCGKHEEYAART